MTKLKIKSEFRDLIPKLTDKEFAQLEENILEAGEVKEPIIVWNGYIVDGHHRWYIIQKHPEIPYTVEEMDFDNEHAAMAWACRNQLGRRNIASVDRDYLIGRTYAEEKLAHGGDRKSSGQNDHLISEVDGVDTTAKRVAKKVGVGEKTVRRDEEYADGLDILEKIKPGMRDEIRAGNVDAPKSVVQKLSKADPETQKKAVDLIAKGEAHKANTYLEGDGNIIDGLYDTGEEVAFTESDLLQEMSYSFRGYMESMDNMLEAHADILDDPAARERIYDTYIGLLKSKLSDLEEEKHNE